VATRGALVLVALCLTTWGGLALWFAASASQGLRGVLAAARISRDADLSTTRGERDNGQRTGYTSGQRGKEPVMRFASVAEVKNQLSQYLAVSRRKREPIVVTHHGKPYALIQPLSEQDLEELEWKNLAKRRLARAWAGEDDALYDYL
jgi:prevent-host-death family protein